MRSLAEIAGRIMYLEQIKEEYILKKEYKKAGALNRALEELFWTLGVDVKR